MKTYFKPMRVGKSAKVKTTEKKKRRVRDGVYDVLYAEVLEGPKHIHIPTVCLIGVVWVDLRARFLLIYGCTNAEYNQRSPSGKLHLSVQPVLG